MQRHKPSSSLCFWELSLSSVKRDKNTPKFFIRLIAPAPQEGVKYENALPRVDPSVRLAPENVDERKRRHAPRPISVLVHLPFIYFLFV